METTVCFLKTWEIVIELYYRKRVTFDLLFILSYRLFFLTLTFLPKEDKQTLKFASLLSFIIFLKYIWKNTQKTQLNLNPTKEDIYKQTSVHHTRRAWCYFIYSWYFSSVATSHLYILTKPLTIFTNTHQQTQRVIIM